MHDCDFLSRHVVHLVSVMGSRGFVEAAGARAALRVMASLAEFSIVWPYGEHLGFSLKAGSNEKQQSIGSSGLVRSCPEKIS